MHARTIFAHPDTEYVCYIQNIISINYRVCSVFGPFGRQVSTKCCNEIHDIKFYPYILSRVITNRVEKHSSTTGISCDQCYRFSQHIGQVTPQMNYLYHKKDSFEVQVPKNSTFNFKNKITGGDADCIAEYIVCRTCTVILNLYNN